MSVTDFGAVGDGVTDDTASIQAAIDACAAQNSARGGILLMPPCSGVYMTTGIIIKAGVVLTGQADYRPYIASSPKSPVTLKAITGSTGWVIDTPAGSTDEWAISGIGVDGSDNAGATMGGIRMQNCHFATLENLAIDRCTDQGIIQAAGYACRFSDILTTNCLMNRTRGSATGTLDLSGSDHYMNRCEWGASQSALSDANMYVNAARIAASTCFIEQSNGESSDQGWLVSGARNRFVNCRGDINWGHGWQLTGGQNELAACVSSTNSRDATNTYDGYRVSGSANVLVGCHAYQVGGAQTHKYSFNDTGSFANPYQRNSFVGCHAGSSSDWGTAPFLTDATQGSGPLWSPHPYRVPNATATPDVSQTTFLVLTLFSTTTTITNFLNGTQGQTLKVLGDVDVTIANNATIKTNTGGNKVLAANTIYTFTYYGGVWYEDA